MSDSISSAAPQLEDTLFCLESLLSDYRFNSLLRQHPVVLINPADLTTLKEGNFRPPEAQNALLLCICQSREDEETRGPGAEI